MFKRGLALTVACFLWSGSVLCADQTLRKPSVAGSFYPANPADLEDMINRYLSAAQVTDSEGGRVQILIEPHAGYVFSGSTAAYGYKLVQNESFESVILIGPCHRQFFQGASIWKKGSWQTPLGTVPIDEELASAIVSENPLFEFTEAAHEGEHSLETQVPFLQKTVKNLKIVPILISDPFERSAKPLAQAIAKHIRGKNVLVVVSTDMSHYLPDAETRPKDELAMRMLEKQNPSVIVEEAVKKNIEFCGLAAVSTGLYLAQEIGETELKIIRYSTSGDATGDRSKVVGYGTSAIFKRSTGATGFSDEQKRALLNLARQTLEAFASGQALPHFKVSDKMLEQESAAFVTLSKKGDLRGCIGSLSATESLWRGVQRMTVQAASQDPRFSPVKGEETKDIKIEISVLKPMKKTDSWREIKIPGDGVLLRRGTKSGVFLPQVAEETLWGRDQFLSELCSQKAGLPSDCWKDPATQMWTFTAEKFSET